MVGSSICAVISKRRAQSRHSSVGSSTVTAARVSTVDNLAPHRAIFIATIVDMEDATAAASNSPGVVLPMVSGSPKR